MTIEMEMISWIQQQVPTFLAPAANFMEDNSSMGERVGVGVGME